MRKVFPTVLFFLLVAGILSCQPTAISKPADPDPVVNAPYFNQYLTEFRGSKIERLINFWRRGRSKEPVEFAAINDQRSYLAFFGQTSADSLPYIDFNRFTLLIGNRGGNGTFTDGPANIQRIEQDLQPQANGDWQYTATVTAKSKGQEWFGFSALAPHVDKPETIKLVMQYK